MTRLEYELQVVPHFPQLKLPNWETMRSREVIEETPFETLIAYLGSRLLSGEPIGGQIKPRYERR